MHVGYFQFALFVLLYGTASYLLGRRHEATNGRRQHVFGIMCELTLILAVIVLWTISRSA
jgi:hypothetical protein